MFIRISLFIFVAHKRDKDMTELNAIQKAKQLLTKVSGENWTISFMNDIECDNYIWSFLYENGLQYLAPIKYDNNMVVLCHQSTRKVN